MNKSILYSLGGFVVGVGTCILTAIFFVPDFSVKNMMSLVDKKADADMVEDTQNQELFITNEDDAFIKASSTLSREKTNTHELDNSLLISKVKEIGLRMELTRDQSTGSFLSSQDIPGSILSNTSNTDAILDDGTSVFDKIVWMSNAFDDQKFCVYAQLAQSDPGDYFAVSSLGAQFTDTEPSSLNCSYISGSNTAAGVELVLGANDEVRVREVTDIAMTLNAGRHINETNDFQTGLNLYEMDFGELMHEIPANNYGQNSEYGWLNNSAYPGDFCVFAALSPSAEKPYFVANRTGYDYSFAKPAAITCGDRGSMVKSSSRTQ